jgi:hypothetical protein
MEDYRIQKREFSADVIERNVGTADKPKWTVWVIPADGRFSTLANELCDYLNFSGLHNPEQNL